MEVQAAALWVVCIVEIHYILSSFVLSLTFKIITNLSLRRKYWKYEKISTLCVCYLSIFKYIIELINSTTAGTVQQSSQVVVVVGMINMIFEEIIINHPLNLLSSAQRPCHQHLSGSRQAALYPGGVGQEDPSLLWTAPGRPGHLAPCR